VGLCSTLLALAALVAPAGAKRDGGGAPPPEAIHVVARTRDDVFIGRDLRYADGAFQLSVDGTETRLPEAEVAGITFAVLPRDDPRDMLVTLAAFLAQPRRYPMGKRPPVLSRLRDGIFILPDEPVDEAFRRAVPKVQHPDLASVLCAEVIRRCMADRAPQHAIDLFKEAEAARKDDPVLAFVYGLIEAAVQMEGGNHDAAKETLRRLEQSYPMARRALNRFHMLTGPEGERPGPPRPPPEP